MSIKTKRTLCRVMGAAALMGMLFIVGGLDAGWMPVGRGAALGLALEAVGFILWYKGGIIKI